MPDTSSGWQDYQSQVASATGPNQGTANNLGGTWGGNTGRDLGIGILGGPIGWYALAAHDQNLMNATDFGGIWKGTSLNKSMTEEVYNSMSDQEWQNFAKMNEQDQNRFIQQRAMQQAKTNSIRNKIQAFADEMNMPIDQLLKKDDFAKGLQNMSINSANATAYGRGIGGGLSTQNADLTSKSALLGYQMKRQEAGQQALDRLSGMDQTNQALNDQKANAFLAQQNANKQQLEGAVLSAFGGYAGMAGKLAGMGQQQQPQQYGQPTSQPISYGQGTYGTYGSGVGSNGLSGGTYAAGAGGVGHFPEGMGDYNSGISGGNA